MAQEIGRVSLVESKWTTSLRSSGPPTATKPKKRPKKPSMTRSKSMHSRSHTFSRAGRPVTMGLRSKGKRKKKKNGSTISSNSRRSSERNLPPMPDLPALPAFELQEAVQSDDAAEAPQEREPNLPELPPEAVLPPTRHNRLSSVDDLQLYDKKTSTPSSDVMAVPSWLSGDASMSLSRPLELGFLGLDELPKETRKRSISHQVPSGSLQGNRARASSHAPQDWKQNVPETVSEAPAPPVATPVAAAPSAGSDAEFRVDLVATDSAPVALGSIHVPSDATLATARALIFDELDFVPDGFVFARSDGVPVGTRQEAKRTVSSISSPQSVITIRKPLAL